MDGITAGGKAPKTNARCCPNTAPQVIPVSLSRGASLAVFLVPPSSNDTSTLEKKTHQ
jgi:hypothetical protein